MQLLLAYSNILEGSRKIIHREQSHQKQLELL